MMMKTRKQGGFSLLELLLALTVFLTIMMGIFSLMQTYAEREVARATTKYMKTVAEAMDQILNDVDNFTALYTAALNSGGGYQLTADASASAPPQDNIAKNFQVSGTWIQGSRLLNSDFRPLSPLRSDIRILLRVADNPASTADTPALEFIIVTRTPRPEDMIRRAAAEAGPAGGFIRSFSGKGNAVIEHAFGSWRVTPANGLQATAWYTSDLPASLDAENTGSYFAYYSYVNIEDRAGDYLHRIRDVDPTLERNTMYAPFNIGGNDIVGADNFDVGNGGSALPFAAGGGTPVECEGGIMCVNGTMILKGSGSIGGTMDTQGSALIADSMNAAGMRVENGLNNTQRQTYGAQNLFVVDGNGNDGGGVQDRIHVTGNALFVDGTTAQTGDLGNITSTTLTMPDGGDLSAYSISNARRISSSTISARRLNVDNQLQAGIVQNGNVNVTGGRAAAIDIYNSRDLIYGSNSNAKTLRVPRLEVGTMRIQNFGACNQGCGD